MGATMLVSERMGATVLVSEQGATLLVSGRVLLYWYQKVWYSIGIRKGAILMLSEKVLFY